MFSSHSQIRALEAFTRIWTKPFPFCPIWEKKQRRKKEEKEEEEEAEKEEEEEELRKWWLERRRNRVFVAPATLIRHSHRLGIPNRLRFTIHPTWLPPAPTRATFRLHHPTDHPTHHRISLTTPPFHTPICQEVLLPALGPTSTINRFHRRRRRHRRHYMTNVTPTLQSFRMRIT